jgi:spore coat protein CotF
MECKYILYDTLESVKNMVVNYSIALNEASSENIYNEYKKQFNDLSELAKDLFNYAYELEWYTLEEEKTDKINKTITKLKSDYEE